MHGGHCLRPRPSLESTSRYISFTPSPADSTHPSLPAACPAHRDAHDEPTPAAPFLRPAFRSHLCTMFHSSDCLLKLILCLAQSRIICSGSRGPTTPDGALLPSSPVSDPAPSPSPSLTCHSFHHQPHPRCNRPSLCPGALRGHQGLQAFGRHHHHVPTRHEHETNEQQREASRTTSQ